MALSAGSRLGPYEILSAIGAGGMGEVYRGRDTKLNRDVALKVLLDAVANDPERLARFHREAQVLASLNHPNIAHIYGVEDSSRVHALVMELVEGPTLAHRIAQGPVPLNEALPIARQIAEALEAAHAQGIIHRDLKPANIKVRADGTVKVLDFGLAKALEPTSAGGANVTASPTITTPAMTQVGVILGTAAYMSPEQAKGRAADRRSDMWAFGCVLYEMLAGRRAFEGEDVPDTLAAVLRGEPDLEALPATTPALIRGFVTRCLAKDPKRRVADTSVPLFVLDQAVISASDTPMVRRATLWRRALPVACAIVVAALVVGAAIGVTAWRLRSTTVPVVTRFAIALPEEQRSFGGSTVSVAVSPDGTLIAYTARRGSSGLYLRSMSDLETSAIPDVQIGVYPVFSPDSRSIAFWSPIDRALKRIPVRGGPAATLYTAADPITGITGLSWDTGGVVFSLPRQGIMRVPARGGEAEHLISAREGEIARGPTVLPGGDAVLFTVVPGLFPDLSDRASIVVQSLRTGERKTIVEGGSDARYLASGHLVYIAGGTLFALPFDVRRLSGTGPAVPVLDGIKRSDLGVAQFSVSDTGSLVYLPGPSSGAASRSDIAVMDFNGNEKPLRLPPGPYEHPRVAPDGRQVTFDSDNGNEAIVWLYNLSGTTAMRRLTFGGRNRFPIWSADGTRIAFQSNREGDLGIFWQRADGTAERLTTPERGTAHVPDSWSADGRQMLFEAIKGLSVSLLTLSIADKRVVSFGEPESQAPFNATFSPDGRWVAYNAQGSSMFVQPFPPTGPKYQLPQRGLYPLWAPDGKRLFYNSPGQIVAVTVSTQPSVAFGNPVALPRGTFLVGGPQVAKNHDITPDGKGIVGVINVASGASDETQTGRPPIDQIQVVLNWQEELKQRVSTK